MQAPQNAFAEVTGGRLSDATTPIETERPESLKKRQITMQVETPTAPKPPQERMTAEEYRVKYAESSPKKSQPPMPQPQPKPQNISADVPEPPRDMLDDIPMEVLEAEAAKFAPQPQPQPTETPTPTPVAQDEEKPLPKFVEVAYFEGGKLIRGSWDDLQPVTEEQVIEEDREEYEAFLKEQEALASQPQSTETPPSEQSPQEMPPMPQVPWRMVGEVFNSYVLVEQGDRMLIIDKHAAHERIIFEQLKAHLHEKGTESQMLMFPIEVMLMSDEVGLLDTYRDELEAIGFSFTCMRNTVKVDMIPTDVDISAVPDMFATFAEHLKEGTGIAKLTRDLAFEKALYQASCKAAIKAGRVYPPEHLEWLVKKLMELPDITCCPHGRPVAMEMSKHHIDHQFERC